MNNALRVAVALCGGWLNWWRGDANGVNIWVARIVAYFIPVFIIFFPHYGFFALIPAASTLAASTVGYSAYWNLGSNWPNQHYSEPQDLIAQGMGIILPPPKRWQGILYDWFQMYVAGLAFCMPISLFLTAYNQPSWPVVLSFAFPLSYYLGRLMPKLLGFQLGFTEWGEVFWGVAFYGMVVCAA